MLDVKQFEENMKVIISGASGFIGNNLSSFLSIRGFEVYKLVRGKPKYENEIFWDPYRKIVDIEKVSGTSVFINLNGENISKGLWTTKRRKILLESRVVPSNFLVEITKNLSPPPKFYFSASAIGIYGPIADKIQSEENPPGDGFLAYICKEWEKTVKPLENTETKTVIMRFGIVLGKNGGMLNYLVRLYKFYFGGIIGNPNSYISWISIEDLCEAIFYLIQKEKVFGGAYNFVSPNPITQRDFAKILSKVVKKPAILRIPSFVIKTILGNMGKELLLASQRVFPEKLLKEGYRFKYTELSQYLNSILS